MSTNRLRPPPGARTRLCAAVAAKGCAAALLLPLQLGTRRLGLLAIGFEDEASAGRDWTPALEVADAVVTIEFMEGVSRKLATKSDKRGEFVQLGLQSGG